MKFEISDWLYNAGLVGLINILESADDEYVIESNVLKVSNEVFENFEEKYFNYFIEKYLKFTSWYRITSLEDMISNFREEDLTEKWLKNLNDNIEYVKAKLKSASYKSGYEIIENKKIDLLEEEKKLKKINLTKKMKIENVIPQIKEQLTKITEIIQYLNEEDVKRIILAKNVIYDIIARFWSDVSFLNKNNAKRDMYQEYEEYFTKSAQNYIISNKEKYKHSCFSCDLPIEKLSKPYSYDLTWINKMGVDMSRKSSHFWNMVGDAFICPLCNIIYSCIPAGFTVIRGRGFFINQSSNMKSLVKVNSTAIDNNTSFEELEDETYYKILEGLSQSEVERINKEIDNIQIVKLDSNNERRPYTFNILSKKMIRIIQKNGKRLRSMTRISVKTAPKEYINIYREVLSRLYNNENQFSLLHKLIHLMLDGTFHRTQILDKILKINNDCLGDDEMVKIFNNEVDEMKKQGIKLYFAYNNKNAINKLNGICYRLLNALKTKNEYMFVDTLISSYMYVGVEMPEILTQTLNDKVNLQTMGYAFIIGLNAQNSKGNKEENDNE